MIKKHDMTKDGMLSFDEFKSIFIDKNAPSDDPFGIKHI